MTPRRSGQETLTRARIIDAALRIVDAEGPDALSMRRLGAALEVDAKTIYYHVPGKSALEDLVVDAVMQEVAIPAEDHDAAPAARAMRLVESLMHTLLEHPRAITLFASRSLTSAASLRPVEHLLGILYEAGLDHPHGIAAVNAIVFFVLGTAMAYAGLDEQHQMQAAQALTALPAEEFPHLTSAVGGSRLLDKSTEFEMGARALVDGLIDRYGS